MGSSAENGDGANARLPVVACPVDELARRKGVHPVRSADDLACNGIFETDEELDEFLAHVAEMRRADPA